MSRTYGYARVSTDDQDLALQVAALERYGVDHIFSEHASGKSMERKNLKRVLKVMRGGDTLVVWKLDRLGRTLTGVLETIEKLNQEGINLVSMTESFDTTSPMGKAFLQIALVFAELERNMISERTKVGMAAKKAAGQKYGRRPDIWHNGRGSEKRLAYLQTLDDADELRRNIDGEWVLIPKAEDLTEELNKAKRMGPKDSRILNPETVRRWRRNGFQGLQSKEPKS